MKTTVFCSRMKDGIWLARVTCEKNGLVSTTEVKKEDKDDALTVALLRSEFELSKKLKAAAVPVVEA